MITWALKHIFGPLVDQKRWAPRRPGQRAPLDNSGRNMRWQNEPDSLLRLTDVDHGKWDDFGIFSGDGLVCLDIDGGCNPATGELEPWAEIFMESLGLAYAEYSISRTGIHVYFYCDIPDNVSFPATIEVNGPNLHGKNPQVEIYVARHYCTVSVDTMATGATSIGRVDYTTLADALNTIEPKPKAENVSYDTNGLDDYDGLVEPDEDELNRMYEFFLYEREGRANNRSDDEFSFCHWVLERRFKLKPLIEMIRAIPGSKFAERADYTLGSLTRSWPHVKAKSVEKWGADFLRLAQAEDVAPEVAVVESTLILPGDLNPFDEPASPLAIIEKSPEKIIPPEVLAAEERFLGISWGDLRRGHFVTEFWINDVLVRAQSCTLGGKSKTMKTTVAVNLAISLLTGRPFLDKFAVNTPAKHIMFFSGESGYPKLKDTILANMNQQEISTPADYDDQLRVYSRTPSMDDTESLKMFRTLIRYYESDVVFIDPLYLSLGAVDVNQATSYGRVLNRIHEVASESGVTMVLLAHTNKTNRGGKEFSKPTIEDFAGSGLQHWSRQWLLLGRRAEYNFDHIHEFHFVVGGSEGHGDSWDLNITETHNPFTGMTIAYEIEKSGAGKTSRSDKIQLLEAIRTLGDEAKVMRLRKSLGWAGTKFKRYRIELVADGLIHVDEDGVHHIN